MFRIFKRRKDKPALIYPVLQRLGEAVRRRQRRCADWLQQKAARFSRRQLRWMLSIFCLIFGGSSLYTFIHALQAPAPARHVDAISVPRHITPPETPAPALSAQERHRISRFIHYMDSLCHSAGGKQRYDSILHERPGLIDSLMAIEHFYQLNE